MAAILVVAPTCLVIRVEGECSKRQQSRGEDDDEDGEGPW